MTMHDYQFHQKIERDAEARPANAAAADPSTAQFTDIKLQI